MSMTRKRFEEEMIVSELGCIKCPKCGEDMIELVQDHSSMTEGQQVDLEMGFNRPFECSECGYNSLFEVPKTDYFEDEEINELVEITRIDPNSFEDVIERALRSKCFIEAISLIHNVIEAYLKRKIEDVTSNDETRLQLLKEKFKPQYLKDYNTLSYILGIIDKQMYKQISDFNNKRNKVIHELLAHPKEIEQIRQIARKGRTIQMQLSPLNHNKEDMKNIMKTFDEITI